MNIKHQIWMFLGRCNLLFPFLKLYERRSSGVKTTSFESDIVIEGYPRCANTFAYVSFKLMQQNEPSNLNIAHHIHGPIQIIRGVKYEIPCILLIRNPIDAVVSLLIRDNSIRPKDAFRNYIKFHQKLINYIDKIVIADFDMVTKDFEKVVEAVNTMFNTSFTVIEMNKSFLEACKVEVKEMDKRDSGNERVDKTKVGIPSKERKILKDEIRTRVNAEVDDDLIFFANQIYVQFKEMSIT